MSKSSNIKYSLHNNNSSKRLLMLSFFMAIAALVIIMRIFELSISREQTKIGKKQNILIEKNYNRGLILDRNNKILASNIYIY